MNAYAQSDPDESDPIDLSKPELNESDDDETYFNDLVVNKPVVNEPKLNEPDIKKSDIDFNERGLNINSSENEFVKGKIACTRQLPLSKRLGTEIVTIHVGPDPISRQFVIHKKLLCEKSEVFNKMFNGGSKEAMSNIALLPDDSPEAFESLVEWLYRGSFAVGDCESKDVCRSMLYVVVAIATLAVKYSIPELLDRATTRFVHIASHYPPTTAIAHVRTVYENTPPRSMFRKFLARSVAFYILNPTRNREMEESQCKLIDDFRSTEGLLEDVIPLLRGMAGCEPPDPIPANCCGYHEHPNKRIKHNFD